MGDFPYGIRPPEAPESAKNPPPGGGGIPPPLYFPEWGRPEAPPLTLIAQQKRDAAIECPRQLRGIGAAGREGRDREP